MFPNTISVLTFFISLPYNSLTPRKTDTLPPIYSSHCLFSVPLPTSDSYSRISCLLRERVQLWWRVPYFANALRPPCWGWLRHQDKILLAVFWSSRTVTRSQGDAFNYILPLLLILLTGPGTLWSYYKYEKEWLPVRPFVYI